MKEFDFDEFERGNVAVLFTTREQWDNFYERILKHNPVWDKSAYTNLLAPEQLKDDGSVCVTDNLGHGGIGRVDHFRFNGYKIESWYKYMPETSAVEIDKKNKDTFVARHAIPKTSNVTTSSAPCAERK